MAISELRFPSPALKFYVEGLGWSALGLALIAWGAVVVAFDPWNWTGAVFILGGTFTAALGVVFTVLIWFIFVLGTVTAWRRWRQLRPPAVVIDATGIRYLPYRGPVLVPWPDVEQLGLRRSIFRNRVVTKVFIRLSPGAALLRDGAMTVPASRSLNVGLLSDLAVPEDIAVQFLGETAGSRLRVTEIDRRTPVDGHRLLTGNVFACGRGDRGGEPVRDRVAEKRYRGNTTACYKLRRDRVGR